MGSLPKVLLRLDEVYNPLTVVIQGKSNISWLDMQSELLIFEKRLEHQNSQKNHANNDARQPGNSYPHNSNQSNGNSQRGGNNFHNSGSRGPGRGRRNKPTCQVCGKYGHSALNINTPTPCNSNQNPTPFVTTYNTNPFATPETVLSMLLLEMVVSYKFLALGIQIYLMGKAT
ncbi:hypothetical protein Csa_011882 [Cucumis sativus]|uniref:Uncharacterized protein n=1 Tax=Cucumis sativus TaxID=3659 RepID=A0A0A0K542_CUCSA|nr:hypothetical protein Csa_011882 [Cucumis sativus]